MARAPRIRPVVLGLALAVALPLGVFLWVRFARAPDLFDSASALRGLAACLGWTAPLSDPALQAIVGLRLSRALVALGVGGALGYSGALVQGLFRNPLASPGLLGISSGASLGAVVAVLVVGGYGPRLSVLEGSASSGLLWIPLAAFVGALAAGALVFRLASSAGQVSIPALLLLGIAVNTLCGGVVQALQARFLDDSEVSRSILSWSFGTLEDRSGWHVATIAVALVISLAAIPFLAYELDLCQGGLEDAEALGVNTGRVRWLALAAAALAAAAAVAVAGQIAFVGLIVPHIVRFASGGSHRSLLWLSCLTGAAFLLGAEIVQGLLLHERALQPGVFLSLVGGPFFLWLVWQKRREFALW